MFLLGLFGSLGVKAQTATGAEVIPIHFPQTSCYITALSDNGQWAVASGTDEENTTISGYPYLINATTGELTELWQGEDFAGYTANDVTDDGKIVVGSYNGAAYYNADTKTWISLPVSEGAGAAVTVTPDGKYIGGYGSAGSFGSSSYREIPYLWERQDDGTYRQVDLATELNRFPTWDKTGADCGLRRIENMSADGNILAGAMNFIYPQDACYYVYNRTTGETVFIDDYLTQLGYGTGSFIDQSNISNDGTYITGHAYIASGDEYTSTYRYNISTKTFDLWNTYNDERDRGGNAVTNDGIVFAASPAVNPLRYDYVRVGNLWFGLDEIMSGRYGINIYDRIGVDYTGIINDVSDDGRVIAGMAMTTGDGYIVRLPETFAEAASAIDPFAAYQISPAEGSQFARFREATIAFSKPTSLASSTVQAQILDESGNVVSGGQRTISANADGISFTIGGRPVTLEPGKKYTLCIPAGTFMLTADNSFTNKEIRIEYEGRENTPTQPLEISPDNGANVSELSTDNPVAIAFDMNIAVATDEDGNPAVGYLYEADGETPLCELTLSATGQALGMAPALTRYLRSGIDYRVVLPANSVTDIMGDCGNEELTITYHGAYTPELPTGENLFFDDFDDPAVSMGTYLLYEGDHNTPSSIPAEWEFDADNNPWNFTLRESTADDDYFAASHSMYNPAGQSDDWMSLPQLTLENADFYLTFKAQSYLYSATDILKVVVLEAEEGYNTFTTDLYNRFQTEGKVVFEEQLSPGKSQDGVYGDWTDYEISLADFAGKSVYIAFVNQNENQSVIFLDSVSVTYRGDFVLTNNTATSVVNVTSAPVSAQLHITGDNTYNDLTATLTDAADNVVSTYTATGLGLTNQSEAYSFTFPEELPLTVGEENSYTISIDLDGNQLTRSATVKDLAFETTKRVLVEEATGQGCGNCPSGILAIENMQRLFGDQVVPVAVHSTLMGADPYADDNYVGWLGVTALPTGRVNRIDSIYAAIVSGMDPVTYENVYSFNGPTHSETWLDIVQREFTNNPVADADVNITKADMNSSTGEITIEGNVNYAVNLNSLNQRLAFVITENDLVGSQHNYYYSQTDPFFGEWGQGGMYGSATVTYAYDHVSRSVIDNAYAGVSGLIPVSVTAGQPVEFSLTREAYQTVSNWSNAELVAILIDSNTGLVVNVNKVRFTIDGETGIGSVDAVAEGADVQAVNGQIVVNAEGDVNVAVFDASGSLVGTAAGTGSVNVDVNSGRGLYIVKVTAGGESAVKKVFVR